MHLAKNRFESKCGRKARVLQEQVILVGDHSHYGFQVIKEEEES